MPTKTFHAVLLDECGDEFGVTITAHTKQDAYDALREDYPENRGIVELMTHEQRNQREQDRYNRLSAEIDGDDPGLDAWDDLCEQNGW